MKRKLEVGSRKSEVQKVIRTACFVLFAAIFMMPEMSGGGVRMWLIPPTLASAYQAESGCLMKPLGSCSPDTELRVSLSGKVVPRPLSWRGWQTRAVTRHLFGAGTLLDLTPAGFLAWWTCWMQGCPASHSVARESRKEIPMPGVGEVIDQETCPPSETKAPAPCRTRSGSSPSVAPPWSSSRTSQLGFAAFEEVTVEESIRSVILDRNYRAWITKSLSRSSSLRKTLKLRMDASASSSWPTIRANEGNAGEWQNQRDGSVIQSLNGVAQNWPSPRAEDSETCGNHPGAQDSLSGVIQNWATPRAGKITSEDPEIWEERQAAGDVATMPLGMQVMRWSTPKATEPDRRLCQSELNRRTQSLMAQTETWATPKADDAKNVTREAGSMGSLARDAFQWPTPMATDSEAAGGPQQSSLNNSATGRYLHPVQDLHSGGELSPTARTLRPRLNPAFGCWLMGWPTWWTHPAAISFGWSEMALWRHRQRLLLQYCFIACMGSSERRARRLEKEAESPGNSCPAPASR